MNRKRAANGLEATLTTADQSAVKKRHVHQQPDGFPSSSTTDKPPNRTIEKKTRRYLGSILSHCHRIMKSINEQLGSPIYMKQMTREFETGTGSTRQYDCDFRQDPVEAIENWVKDVTDLPVIIDTRSLNAFARCHSALKGRDREKKVSTTTTSAWGGGNDESKVPRILETSTRDEESDLYCDVYNKQPDDDANSDDREGEEDEDDDDDHVTITVASSTPSTPGSVKPMIATSALFRNSSHAPRASASNFQGKVISSTILRTGSSSEGKGRARTTNLLTSKPTPLPSSNDSLPTNSVDPTPEDLWDYLSNVKQLALHLCYLYLVLFLQQEEETLSDPFNEQVISRIRGSALLSRTLVESTTSSTSHLHQLAKDHQIDISNLLDEKESKSLLQKLFVSSSELEEIRKQRWIGILEGSIKLDLQQSMPTESQDSEILPPQTHEHSATPSMSTVSTVTGESLKEEMDHRLTDSEGMPVYFREREEIRTPMVIIRTEGKSAISLMTSSSTATLTSIEEQCLTQYDSYQDQNQDQYRDQYRDPFQDSCNIVALSDSGISSHFYDDESSNNDFEIMSESDFEEEDPNRLHVATSVSSSSLGQPSKGQDQTTITSATNSGKLDEEEVHSRSYNPGISQSLEIVNQTTTAIIDSSHNVKLSKDQLKEMLGFVKGIRDNCDGLAQLLTSVISRESS